MSTYSSSDARTSGHMTVLLGKLNIAQKHLEIAAQGGFERVIEKLLFDASCGVDTCVSLGNPVQYRTVVFTTLDASAARQIEFSSRFIKI